MPQVAKFDEAIHDFLVLKRTSGRVHGPKSAPDQAFPAVEHSASGKSNILQARGAPEAGTASGAAAVSPVVCAIRAQETRGTAREKPLTPGRAGISGARRNGDQRVHAHANRHRADGAGV